MVVGVSGRHGSHAAWRVEEETEHVLARALIQLQNGTEWIALGQISPQRAAIWANVKVENTQKRQQFLYTFKGIHVMDCII